MNMRFWLFYAFGAFVLITSANALKVAERWKICRYPEKADEGKAKEIEVLEFLRANIPSALEHTGDTSFDEHLSGVQAVLRNWGAPDHVCLAGLMHSIYGTEGFQGFKLPLSSRPVIRSLIGEKAERLVWIFCMVDRWSVDQTTGGHQKGEPIQFRSRVELGSFLLEVTEEEWLDFIELVLADWLEQVEGASLKENDSFGWKAGEAWSYRRAAYASMASLLADRVPRLRGVADVMHAEVMAVEPEETRGLHMAVTPPLSEAAREARAALASRTL